MRPRAAVLALGLLGGAAAAEDVAPKTYSPSEVLAATKDLDGREIFVRGWLGGCGASDNRICGLYSTRRAAIGHKPVEWPLPVEISDKKILVGVRHVVAHGIYVITCKNTATTICVEYDGFFQVASIEDK